jgi:FlaG/FlaF family flagellin (archaellin)
VRQNRAVSSAIGVVLMVAAVVVVAATTAVFALGVGEKLDEPAPNVAETTGEFEVGDPQRVRITHVSGDVVPADEIEIVVRASGPEVSAEARLVDLPALDQEKDPDNIISFFERDFESDDPSTWSSGDTIAFNINQGGADFEEGDTPDADRLDVLVVHTPSNAVIVDRTFTP